ncbi:MAG: hypothetical protein OXC11_02105 [Rhodospirillales bacterium]|nr:hypothetical protein [Rhodospirillales bacterium]
MTGDSRLEEKLEAFSARAKRIAPECDNEKTMRTISTVIALIAALALAGCLGNGGGDEPMLTKDHIDKVLSDPRVVRAKGIYERADTLLVPSVYLDASFSSEGVTEREQVAVSGDCSGTRCTLSGEGLRGSITLEDLLTEDLIVPTDTTLTKADLGEREGFDTLAREGRSRIAEKVGSSSTIAATASATHYGAWGQHGYAAVEIADGPFPGSLEGVPFSGSIKGAVSYAFGTVNPTNPTGPGSATWQGPVEAPSTRTFKRYPGKATLTIPDLALPMVDAEIAVAGNDISAPAWKDMPLTQGTFTSGSVEGKDYLEGNFHGPKHEEAYGVFDTGAYVGAFGAMRQ